MMKEKDTDPTSNGDEGLIKELDDDMETTTCTILSESTVREHDANSTSTGGLKHTHSVFGYSNVLSHWIFDEEVALLITSKGGKYDAAVTATFILGKEALSIIVPMLHGQGGNNVEHECSMLMPTQYQERYDWSKCILEFKKDEDASYYEANHDN
eukprot:11684326-Ditylum_brightwellii.AAC.1